MAKFRKLIVSAGDYMVSRLNGAREREHISASRLEAWAKKANKMLKKGIRIPAPWSHIDEKGNVPMPVVMDQAGTLPRSDINAGWWENFEVREGALYGELEVPGSPDNSSDPAYKVGKTVRETSVVVKPYIDGTGEDWGESIMHVALVTHPIEPSQENFEPLLTSLIEENSPLPLVLAMSTQVQSTVMADSQEHPSDQKGGLTIQDVIEHLSKVGIILLEDTTAANLVERLVSAVKQKIQDQEAPDTETKGGVRSPPPNSQTQPAPVAMSETPNQASIESLEAQLEAQKQQTTLLMAQFTDQKKIDLKKRIESLVTSGRIGKDYAEKELLPQVESLVMSLNEDGTFSKTPLETILSALESAQPLTKPILDGKGYAMSAPSDSQEESNEDFLSDDGEDLTDEQIQELVELG